MQKLKSNKNILIVLLAIIVIILAVLYFFGFFEKENYCTEISLAELEEKLENKDTFVIFFGSTVCIHCKDFQPTINQVIKDDGITIYYLNVYKLSSEENNKLLSLINYGSSTPQLYFIENGEYSQYNKLSGARSYKEVVEKLEKNGYIK